MRFSRLLELPLLIVFALCVLFLFGGTASAQPREFAQPVFVVYSGPAPTFAAPRFVQPAGNCFNCTTCVNCPCFGGGYYCADGKCPVTFPVNFAPTTAAAKKFKDCPECEEAERAYQLRQAAKNGGSVVYASGSACASGNCGATYQQPTAASYGYSSCSSGNCGVSAGYSSGYSSCASGSCGTSRTSRTWGIAKLFSRR